MRSVAPRTFSGWTPASGSIFAVRTKFLTKKEKKAVQVFGIACFTLKRKSGVSSLSAHSETGRKPPSLQKNVQIWVRSIKTTD